jgi:hypothetical protein
VFVERIRARCASGEPADGQPVASDSSTAAKLLSACCRVVRVHGWRGAHAWCVRVERALHACARVQGAGQRVRAWQWRGRGVGECRCSTCLFCALCYFFSAPAQNALQAYAKGPERGRGHKTRNPVPKKGSVTKLATPSPKKVGHITRPIPKRVGVTKLATPSREKGRSQNSRPRPGKRVGHKTRDRVPEKGSVTKLATPSRKKARSHNLAPPP